MNRFVQEIGGQDTAAEFTEGVTDELMTHRGVLEVPALLPVSADG